MHNKNYSEKKPFAEVIEAELTQFTAQCWKWDLMPFFGQLVSVNNIIGCVTEIKTGPHDTMHTVTAYGLSEEQLKKEQPQIFELLTTTFEVLVMGYFDEPTDFSPSIPPYPAKIHGFVNNADGKTLKLILQNAKNLGKILSSQLNTNIKTELLASAFKQFLQVEEINTEFLEELYNCLLKHPEYQSTQIREIYKQLEKTL
ncbi:hypothetical protein KAU11_02935 [Candidatus Babeliales bacterium]|nr:hypothetical protein [Candidatus Babeliales bacterium]